jgi:hypothetical protein
VNTKRVNSAAGVILAAITQNRTAAGIALALESAGLLMSPEIAAELETLRAKVAEYERPADDSPIAYALTDKADDVTPQVQTLRALLAGQRAAVEDPHDSPLHHDYRVSRELPEVGL